VSIYQQAKSLTVPDGVVQTLSREFGEEYRRWSGVTYCMRFGVEVPRLKLAWDVVRRDCPTDAAALDMMRRIFRVYFHRVSQWRRDGYTHEPCIRSMYDRLNSLRLDIAEYDRERQKRIESARSETAAQILRDIQG